MASAAQTLARSLLAAASAREASFNKEECKRALDSNAQFTDYSKFYGLTLEKAAEQNSPPTLAHPVYLMLKYTWNDAIEWAAENK